MDQTRSKEKLVSETQTEQKPPKSFPIALLVILAIIVSSAVTFAVTYWVVSKGLIDAKLVKNVDLPGIVSGERVNGDLQTLLERIKMIELEEFDSEEIAELEQNGEDFKDSLKSKIADANILNRISSSSGLVLTYLPSASLKKFSSTSAKSTLVPKVYAAEDDASTVIFFVGPEDNIISAYDVYRDAEYTVYKDTTYKNTLVSQLKFAKASNKLVYTVQNPDTSTFQGITLKTLDLGSLESKRIDRNPNCIDATFKVSNLGQYMVYCKDTTTEGVYGSQVHALYDLKLSKEIHTFGDKGLSAFDWSYDDKFLYYKDGIYSETSSGSYPTRKLLEEVFYKFNPKDFSKQKVYTIENPRSDNEFGVGSFLISKDSTKLYAWRLNGRECNSLNQEDGYIPGVDYGYYKNNNFSMLASEAGDIEQFLLSPSEKKSYVVARKYEITDVKKCSNQQSVAIFEVDNESKEFKKVVDFGGNTESLIGWNGDYNNILFSTQYYNSTRDKENNYYAVRYIWNYNLEDSQSTLLYSLKVGWGSY